MRALVAAATGVTDTLTAGDAMVGARSLLGEWTLDDAQLRTLHERLQYLRGLEEKKEQVLSAIEEQGNLTEELKGRILAAQTLVEVEDLYRPYRPKRRTRETARDCRACLACAGRPAFPARGARRRARPRSAGPDAPCRPCRARSDRRGRGERPRP